TTYKQDPPPSMKPALHARLIEVLNEATENEAHRGFRAIAHPNAIAVMSRVKAACTMAGLDQAFPQRRLVLLRNGAWPTGKRTKEILDGFIAAGGIIHSVPEADLKTMAALRQMRETSGPHFAEWLASRRPASNIPLFKDVLEAPVGQAEPTVTTEP